MKITRKIISAAAAVTIVAATSFGLAHGAKADGHAVKVGVILGFTGPIESLTPGMAASAELAMKEVTDSGKLLGGKDLMAVRADSTCVDSAAATAAADRLITSDSVAAIMGADCSGVTTSGRRPLQKMLPVPVSTMTTQSSSSSMRSQALSNSRSTTGVRL